MQFWGFVESSSPSDMTFAVPLLSCTTNHPQNVVTWVSAETLCMNPCVRLISGGLAMHPPLATVMTRKDIIHLFGDWWLRMMDVTGPSLFSCTMFNQVFPYDSDHSRSKWKYSRPLDAFESGIPLLLRSFGEILFCFIVNFFKTTPKTNESLLMGRICMHKQGAYTCKISYLLLSQS